jgi:thioredoxin-like negative regulator of GroEL
LTYYELASREESFTEEDLNHLAAIEESLRERLFRNESDSEALYLMGRLHQLDSDWDSALEFYKAALEVGIRDEQRDSFVQERVDAIYSLPDYQLTQLTRRVESNPNNIELRLILARDLFELKRYFEANEHAKKILDHDPNNPEAIRIIGWSDIGLEEYWYERIRTMRTRIRENSEDYEASLTLARLLKNVEIYPESLRYYFYYLSAHPDDYEVRKEYAQVLSWDATQVENAAREYGILARLRPEDLEVQLQYYELSASQGEFDSEALYGLSLLEDRLRERLYYDDMDHEALYSMGRLHQIDDNWNSALDYFEAALLAGSDEATVQDRIDSIVSAPDFKIAALEARVANDPSNTSLRMSLARLLFENERYYQAREQADIVRQQTGNNSEAIQISQYSNRWIEDERVGQLENLRLRVSQNPRDLEAQLALARDLRGRGAFSRFKNMMYENGLDQRWFDFKNQEDRRRALEWLRSMDLISDSDVETGLQLHDERVQYRKQRKLDIKNMQAGAQVRCIDDHGHIDKLTIGKDYKILDEQPEHRNIYIQDDRGKTVWMPKSHFEIKEIENKILYHTHSWD